MTAPEHVFATSWWQEGDDPIPMGALPYGSGESDDDVLLVLAGLARFADVTYDDALRRLSAGGAIAAARVVPVGRFAAAAEAFGPPAMHLVFHVGRCGSTLLVRMLGADRAVCLFSEPNAWPHYQRAVTLAGGSPKLDGVADACVRTFGRFARDRGQTLVVKPTSWQVLHGAPTTADGSATVYLFRSAPEVVASNVARPPGFVATMERDLSDGAGAVAGWLPGTDADLLADPVLRYAELWRACGVAALDLLPDALVVAYDDLMADPPRTLERVVAHLGLANFPIDIALRQRDYYAKAGGPTARYEPEGRHARPPLPPETAASVSAITADVEARLRARAEEQRDG